MTAFNITVSRKAGEITEYLYGEDEEPLRFDSVKDAIRYLSDRNFTPADFLEFDFNIEEKNNAAEARA